MHKIECTATLAIVPSDNLYRMVRAGFVAKGTTLNAWCIANGINRQTAEQSLKAERNGRKSREIRTLLIAASLGGDHEEEAAFVDLGAVADRAGISRRALQIAAARIASGKAKTWRGAKLVIRVVEGRGGHSGLRYQVRIDSLPADLRTAA